ncbi:glutaredoxin 3 [Methylocella sp.]|uniref:glutaredoxin 3 n=1 Tax=Methylocella sp. TaxID=1978226 RepID=UPI0035B42AB9
MTQITIYTTASCPYCQRAKALFAQKGLAFKEIPVDDDFKMRAELAERTGRRTVPQIFFGERHVGGCDDLYELNDEGKIEQILAEQTQ